MRVIDPTAHQAELQNCAHDRRCASFSRTNWPAWLQTTSGGFCTPSLLSPWSSIAEATSDYPPRRARSEVGTIPAGNR